MSKAELQQGADMSQQQVKKMLDQQEARRGAQVVGYDADQAARRSSQPYDTGLGTMTVGAMDKQQAQADMKARKQAAGFEDFRPAAANNLLVPEYQYVANTAVSTRSGKKDHSDRSQSLLPGGAKMIEGFGQIRPINTSQSVVNPSLDMRDDIANL